MPAISTKAQQVYKTHKKCTFAPAISTSYLFVDAAVWADDIQNNTETSSKISKNLF